MDIFKGRLAASEGSYHKKEQEYVLKEYRDTLIKEGKLDPKAALAEHQKNLKQIPGAVKTSTLLGEKELVDVLPNILQQQARLSAPETAEVARARSMMPPISAAKNQVSFWSGDHSPAKVPAIGLGRSRWAVNEEQMVVYLPEEDAAIKARNALAEKAARASGRAVMYGAALSLVGTMVAARLLMAHYNISSVEDMREFVNQSAAPLAQGMKGTFSPVTASLQERYRLEGLEEGSYIALMSARLKKRFEKYKGNAFERS
uniref:Uncharacterized protein n=1 Tax=Pyramimonas obovata TaxID=1411642 RepID=A0A7S0R135_9CHLO|mmetsp:Transcript_22920/g.50261  ORF Transcript_22920/g.50261 Transcript_22920/m.50261 type:complete len:259 (+) Transcript_22920:315-1091(+)|eukprot:CAMPEP_0118930858 /NCGR_PEP_ID=MMETSP1169-20130426/7404_1 /TAXON_ID=36882 /ORGANISM="Pyramimonas obovata, Strain CCMP722" /LENGTH=258 /DNA_ID=CAMNT_0006873277 /DNA_START=288 /DNA_END=1064 /DNA_ORIENTATION=-